MGGGLVWWCLVSVHTRPSPGCRRCESTAYGFTYSWSVGTALMRRRQHRWDRQCTMNERRAHCWAWRACRLARTTTRSPPAEVGHACCYCSPWGEI
eukprot:2785538-Prymnesium_polylepis.1